jgi:hypothetical protein
MGKNFSIEIIHPSGKNSFISASNFTKISIFITGLARMQEQLVIRSTLHSDGMYAHDLQWAEGFEWSFMIGALFSKDHQVRGLIPQ